MLEISWTRKAVSFQILSSSCFAWRCTVQTQCPTCDDAGDFLDQEGRALRLLGGLPLLVPRDGKVAAAIGDEDGEGNQEDGDQQQRLPQLQGRSSTFLLG